MVRERGQHVGRHRSHLVARAIRVGNCMNGVGAMPSLVQSANLDEIEAGEDVSAPSHGMDHGAALKVRCQDGAQS